MLCQGIKQPCRTTSKLAQRTCQQQKLSFSRDEAIWGGDSGSRGSKGSVGNPQPWQSRLLQSTYTVLEMESLLVLSPDMQFFEMFVSPKLLSLAALQTLCKVGSLWVCCVSECKGCKPPLCSWHPFLHSPGDCISTAIFVLNPARCNEIPELVSQRHPASRERSRSALDCKPRHVIRTSQLLHKWREILYKF